MHDAPLRHGVKAHAPPETEKKRSYYYINIKVDNLEMIQHNMLKLFAFWRI